MQTIQDVIVGVAPTPILTATETSPWPIWLKNVSTEIIELDIEDSDDVSLDPGERVEVKPRMVVTGTSVSGTAVLQINRGVTPDSEIKQGATPAEAIYVQMLGALGMMNGPNIYKSGIHFTAVWQAPTAIDLAGHPTVTSVGQFWAVAQISSANVITVFSPLNSTTPFSWSVVDNRLTITGGVFDPTDTFVVVLEAVDRFASLPGNFLMTGEVHPPHLKSDSTGTSLLAAAQDITDAWADVGSVQNVFGKSSATGFFQVDINDDEGIEFRALLLQDPAGADEYPAQILTVLPTVTEVQPHLYNIVNDVDQYVPLSVVMAKEIPGVQWQVRRLVDGAGVDAQVDSAYTMGGV